MPTRKEIEAAARVMCLQNNDCPDLHLGGVGTNSRPQWMKYRRKAAKILEAAEVARKKRSRACKHPWQLREQYDGDAFWTCTSCGEEFETQDSETPLTDEELRALIRQAKQAA